MTFGEKLRESRKDAGLSQEGLAEKLNVSRQAITKWETNAGIPDIANLMAISNLFGITLDDFVSEEKLAKQVKSRLYTARTSGFRRSTAAFSTSLTALPLRIRALCWVTPYGYTALTMTTSEGAMFSS